MNFEILQHLITDTIGSTIGGGIVEFLKGLGKKAGEQITAGDLRQMRYGITGKMSYVDEHMFKLAETEISKTEAGLVSELNRKLKDNLDSEMQDRYRIMLLGPYDISDKDEKQECLEKMIEMMKVDALKSEDDWENMKEVLNLQRVETESKFHKVFTTLGRDAEAVIKSLYAGGKVTVQDLYAAAVKLGVDTEHLLKIREAANNINEKLEERADDRRTRLEELRNKPTRLF